ncbi:hypothetical protein ACFLSE_09320 [Bacteroidota bacterium]
MRKFTYLLIGILFLNTNILIAQESNKIETKQNFGVIFLQNGKKLTPKQLLEITKDNPEAYQEMKIAKSNYAAANVLSFTGGFMVGWQLANVMTGKEVEYSFLGIGGGLIGISIIVSQSYSNHARKAVGIYNSSLTQTSMKKVDFNFGFTRTGIGITMNF